MVWLQVLVLLHSSIAAHIRVAEKLAPQIGFVTVLRMTIRLVPQESAGALGGSKDQGVPNSTVRLVPQVMVGKVLSSTVTVCVQVFVRLHRSTAAHNLVAVKLLPQIGLVVVFRIKTMLVPHESIAVGVSKIHAVPHSLVLFGRQKI